MTDSPFQPRLAPRSRSDLRQRIASVAMRDDVVGVVCFCLIGLLLTLNFILRFPELGALIAQYNQF
jgi:hypothetical protein